MDQLDVAVLLPGITALVQVVLNFVTGAWPTRPTWAAYLIAVVCGIGGAFLIATAQRLLIDQAVAAQLVIVGVMGSAAAAGINYQSTRSEALRQGELQRQPALIDTERIAPSIPPVDPIGVRTAPGIIDRPRTRVK